MIKVLQDLNFVDSKINMHMYETVEEMANPIPGDFSMIDGVAHVYTSIRNSEPQWLPLGVKRLQYTHNQAIARNTWSIEHNLSTHDLIVAVYDDSNKIVLSEFTVLTPDTIEVKLNTMMTGKCVIFGSSEEYAGFSPEVKTKQVNNENVTFGYAEPTADMTASLYMMIEE
jgi:hypothetical protein